MKHKRKYSVLKHLDFLFLDFICIELSFFFACLFRKNAFLNGIRQYLFILIIAGVTFFGIVMFWNIYSGILRRNFFDELKSSFALISEIFVSLTMYCFLTKSTEEYSRVVLVAFFSIAFPLDFLFRVLLKELVRKKIKNRNGETLLFIREEDVIKCSNIFTNQAESGVIATGIVTYEKTDKKEIGGIPIVCSKEGLRSYIESHRVDCVFIHLQEVSVHSYIDFLVKKDVVVYRSLRNLEKSSLRYRVEEMNGYKALCIRERKQSLGQAVLKRAGDIIGACIGLMLTLPITLITAILIKLEDGGPVLYVSKRVGQHGKEFSIYKFRSMKLNADKLEDMLTPEELEQYYREYKLENDPRVTRIGAVIRKFSIDELPQLINIIKGDMSFVGPRPLVEKETQLYGAKRELLLSLKPGLTGYWQAYGRNNVTYESGKRQEMELYYIEQFSWWFDIKIMIRTVKAVLTADGAG